VTATDAGTKAMAETPAKRRTTYWRFPRKNVNAIRRIAAVAREEREGKRSRAVFPRP